MAAREPRLTGNLDLLAVTSVGGFSSHPILRSEVCTGFVLPGRPRALDPH